MVEKKLFIDTRRVNVNTTLRWLKANRFFVTKHWQEGHRHVFVVSVPQGVNIDLMRKQIIKQQEYENWIKNKEKEAKTQQKKVREITRKKPEHVDIGKKVADALQMSIAPEYMTEQQRYLLWKKTGYMYDFGEHKWKFSPLYIPKSGVVSPSLFEYEMFGDEKTRKAAQLLKGELSEEERRRIIREEPEIMERAIAMTPSWKEYEKIHKPFEVSPHESPITQFQKGMIDFALFPVTAYYGARAFLETRPTPKEIVGVTARETLRYVNPADWVVSIQQSMKEKGPYYTAGTLAIPVTLMGLDLKGTITEPKIKPSFKIEFKKGTGKWHPILPYELEGIKAPAPKPLEIVRESDYKYLPSHPKIKKLIEKRFELTWTKELTPEQKYLMGIPYLWERKEMPFKASKRKPKGFVEYHLESIRPSYRIEKKMAIKPEEIIKLAKKRAAERELQREIQRAFFEAELLKKHMKNMKIQKWRQELIEQFKGIKPPESEPIEKIISYDLLKKKLIEEKEKPKEPQLPPFDLELFKLDSIRQRELIKQMMKELLEKERKRITPIKIKDIIIEPGKEEIDLFSGLLKKPKVKKEEITPPKKPKIIEWKPPKEEIPEGGYIVDKRGLLTKVKEKVKEEVKTKEKLKEELKIEKITKEKQMEKTKLGSLLSFKLKEGMVFASLVGLGMRRKQLISPLLLPKQKTLLGGLEKGIQLQKQKQKTTQKNKQTLKFGQSLIPAQTTLLSLKLVPKLKTMMSEIEPIRLKTKRLSLFPEMGFDFLKGFGKKKVTERKYKYEPSLIGVTLGLEAIKPPKLPTITGLGIRPVVKKRR